ncbi:hypothetical protein [Novosphingobium sp. 9]|uniref:hypothetical protein n=1 Tax=Novosphingobium sp. 9 TaxID=2025349 RepID=UPI0021B5D425|nr:hypothetical protein [Novosphingobium sp. 9]
MANQAAIAVATPLNALLPAFGDIADELRRAEATVIHGAPKRIANTTDCTVWIEGMRAGSKPKTMKACNRFTKATRDD